MKTAIRAFASFLLSLLCCTSFAQTSFYVRAGGNLSRFYTPKFSFSPLLGGQVGVMADVGISYRFSVQTTLQWVAKGTSGVWDGRDASGNFTRKYYTTSRLNYLEFPVVVAYKTKLGKSAAFVGGLGGYAALGLSGIERGDGMFDDQKVRFVNGNRSNASEYNRYDYGACATAGLQCRKVLVLIQYSHGIPTNYISDIPNILMFNNRTLGVSVGYRVGKS